MSIWINIVYGLLFDTVLYLWYYSIIYYYVKRLVMTEKNVRIKIKSIMSDLMAFNVCAGKIGEERAVEAVEEDVIEFSSDAVIRDDGKNIELIYKESEEMGMPNTATSLIFSKDDPNLLNMIRTGENTASFLFNDTVKRQRCAYNAGGFPMEICVCTRSIDNRITMDGGSLELDYLVEIQGVKTQRNRFSVRVDELRR